MIRKGDSVRASCGNRVFFFDEVSQHNFQEMSVQVISSLGREVLDADSPLI